MFLRNKYTAWYFKIINKAKSENRRKGTEVYYENHHILPRCLGGSNEKDNLVLLTAREHFIAHWLLCKMTHSQNRRKMQHAFWRLTNKNNIQDRIINSSQYEIARQHVSLAMSNRPITNEFLNKCKKRRHSSETKLKISKARLEQYKQEETIPWNKGLTGVQVAWNRGKPWAIETRRKMSNAKLKYIYEVISPNNEIYTINNLSEFSRYHNLNRACMHQLTKNKNNTGNHQGWKARIVKEL